MNKIISLCCALLCFGFVLTNPTWVFAKKKHQVDGMATWYGNPFHGRHTASGAIFNMNRPTAAHMTFPFGTVVEVRDLKMGHRTVVVVADRGPMSRKFCIDLSRAAGLELDLGTKGVTPAKIHVVGNTKGEIINPKEAFYVQISKNVHGTKEKVGPFNNFKDAAVMQEMLKASDKSAKIIISDK